MIFGRVKPLDAILATAEKKSLKRSLGAFQLTLFGIGCIIGTGIFVLTVGRRAEGRAGPDALLHHRRRGLRRRRALLCRDRLDGPGRGLRLHLHLCGRWASSLAWTVGWALRARICDRGQRRLGRLVGLFRRHDIGSDIRDTSARMAQGRAGLARRRRGRPDQPAGLRHRPAGDLAADDRHDRERARQRGAGGDQDRRAHRLHRR